MRKFCAVAELANKQLEKIEECTEKTPSQELVWPQVTNIFFTKIYKNSKIRLENISNSIAETEDEEGAGEKQETDIETGDARLQVRA